MFFGRDDPDVTIPVRLEPTLAVGDESLTAASSQPILSPSSKPQVNKKSVKRRNRSKKPTKNSSTTLSAQDGGSDSDSDVRAQRSVYDRMFPRI